MAEINTGSTLCGTYKLCLSVYKTLHTRHHRSVIGYIGELIFLCAMYPLFDFHLLRDPTPT